MLHSYLHRIALACLAALTISSCSDDPDPDPDPDPKPDPDPDPEPPVTYDYVGSLKLRLADSYLSGFTLGTPVKALTAQIRAINPDAAVTIMFCKMS